MSYSDFSSLPPEQEQSFVVFEQTTRESAKKAKSAGIIAGGVFGLLIVVIAMGFKPAEKSHASEEEHSLGAEKASHSAPAKKEEPKVAAPSEAVPAEAVMAKEGEAQEAAPAVEAPKPPPGATKAPPTALIGQ